MNPECFGRRFERLAVRAGPRSQGVIGLLLATSTSACLGAEVWDAPPVPEDARSVFILSSGGSDHVLLRDLEEQRSIWTELEGGAQPRLVAYSAIERRGLWAPNDLLPSTWSTCDRSRPIPEPIASYSLTGDRTWHPDSTAATELIRYRLPPIPIDSCAAAGCLSAAGGSFYCDHLCQPPVAPAPPQAPACPAGWSLGADGECQPPGPSACRAEPCWLSGSELDAACVPRPVPSGATVHTSTSAPRFVTGKVFLPRGAYGGHVHLGAGAELYGECPEATTISGRVDLADGTTLSAVTVRAGVEPGVVVGREARGVHLSSLRVLQGGIEVNSRAEVVLDSVHVVGGEYALAIQGGLLRGRYLWISGTPAVGILVDAGALELEDVVVESARALGVGIVDSPKRGAGSARIERAVVNGGTEAAWSAQRPFEVTDLRLRGHGISEHGLLLSGSSALGRVSRAEITECRSAGTWVRDRAALHAEDLVIAQIGVGVVVTASVTLARVKIDRVVGAGLNASDNVNLSARDLQVRGGEEGLRIIPNDRPEVSVAIQRALVEDTTFGINREGPRVSIEETTVRRAQGGVRSTPCWIDDTLSHVHLEDVRQAAELAVE